MFLPRVRTCREEGAQKKGWREKVNEYKGVFKVCSCCGIRRIVKRSWWFCWWGGGCR